MLIRPIIGQPSGSVGGLTAAHNKGGYYLRSRSVPTDPASSYQGQVRDAMASLVAHWSETLTQTQREAWADYAASVPVPNPLGDSITLSGFNWYTACNIPRLQADTKMSTSLGRIDDAPVIFNRGAHTVPVPTLTETSGQSIAYDNGDDWATQTGGALLIYQGLPQNAGRNFFKGPWRLSDVVAGDDTTPPTSPAVVANAFLALLAYELSEGQKVWMRFVSVLSDGRCTAGSVVGPTTVGA